VWLHTSGVVGKLRNILLQFLAESNGERILKIDQHLAKLLTKNVVDLFYDSQCSYQMKQVVISCVIVQGFIRRCVDFIIN